MSRRNRPSTLGSKGSKKGNAVIDTVMIIVVLLCFVIFTFVAKLVFNYVNDDLQADDDISNLTKEVVTEQHDRFGSFFDGTFVFLVVLLWILALAASFNINAHPIFFILTVVLLIFVFIVGAMISNVYEEFAEDSEISAVAADFPMTDWIMNHLLTVTIVVGFSIVLMLYGKSRYT